MLLWELKRGVHVHRLQCGSSTAKTTRPKSPWRDVRVLNEWFRYRITLFVFHIAAAKEEIDKCLRVFSETAIYCSDNTGHEGGRSASVSGHQTSGSFKHCRRAVCLDITGHHNKGETHFLLSVGFKWQHLNWALFPALAFNLLCMKTLN